MSAGVVIARQNRYISAFMQADATSLEKAKPLQELNCKKSYIFSRMVVAGIFIKCDDEKYYIDVEKTKSFMIRRRNFLLGTVFLILILAGIFSVI